MIESKKTKDEKKEEIEQVKIEINKIKENPEDEKKEEKEQPEIDIKEIKKNLLSDE